MNAELAKVVSEARKHRGGKPAKYPGLEKYGDSIVKLLDSDVQLPYILKWLVEEKKEDLECLLRKYPAPLLFFITKQVIAMESLGGNYICADVIPPTGGNGYSPVRTLVNNKSKAGLLFCFHAPQPFLRKSWVLFLLLQIFLIL